jgi:predicted P-loop ATPase
MLPSTLPNVAHLLQCYGIVVRYDSVKKKLRIAIPGHTGTTDNADNTAMTIVLSLASLHGMALGQIPSLVEAIGDRNPHNPVADWITSKPWDGKDRLPELVGTLQEREDFCPRLKRILVYRWLLSAVAAALMPKGFKARGVLTFQGPQGIGKTSWVMALVSDPGLRETVIKIDHHLDPHNKDSILGAITHWIVEIGELDSSFRKSDVSRLKGVLTSDSDRVRRPYARTESEYLRRTVFCATVNEENFLVDHTGNTRWWTLPLAASRTVRLDWGL